MIRFDVVQEGSGEEPAAAGEGEDSELVFEAKEYTEVMRMRCINPTIAWRMEMYK